MVKYDSKPSCLHKWTALITHKVPGCQYTIGGCDVRVIVCISNASFSISSPKNLKFFSLIYLLHSIILASICWSLFLKNGLEYALFIPSDVGVSFCSFPVITTISTMFQ